MRLFAVSAVLALLIAQPAAARQDPPEAFPQMPLARKAGCGLTLIALQKGAQRYPEVFNRAPADRRAGMQFLLQALGAQGQVMFDEAVSEGMAAGMSPSQIYAAGVDDMLQGTSGLNPASRGFGESLLQRLADRCAVDTPAG